MHLPSTEQLLHDYAQRLIVNAESNQHIELDKIRKYAIISTPRIASSMVCKRLEETEVLGWPTEWFNQRYIKAYLNIQGTNELNFEQYLNILLRGAASNDGIFGVNFHIAHYINWIDVGIDLLKIKFDKIYWVERKDKIQQAYSYAKTKKTDVWSKEQELDMGMKEGIEVEITPKEVASILKDICDWCEYYNERIKVNVDKMFYYEDIVKDHGNEMIKTVLNDFALSQDHIKHSIPMQKQATDFDAKQITKIKKYFSGEEDS